MNQNDRFKTVHYHLNVEACVYAMGAAFDDMVTLGETLMPIPYAAAGPSPPSRPRPAALRIGQRHLTFRPVARQVCASISLHLDHLPLRAPLLSRRCAPLVHAPPRPLRLSPSPTPKLN